ncbi:hypothetical protein [Pseudoalteromonas simplex]|uniref:hypothetical protein n=1 Tax=Pseudoalteromonas simplex TaxID=2783613 RepID=UPI0018892FC8|nr:hypothetical protein [Pseudoalteromonas sp. A520]
MFVSSMSLALAMTTNTFLVMGDMPYTPIDEINLAKDGKITKAIAATPHGFLIHLGDMKSGALACTNKLLQTNKALLTSLTKQPFIYTPGDNEWTDCDREKLSVRFDELERLSFVKGLMFDEAYTQKAKQLQGYATQAEMLENARWQFDGIEFRTLHIPGTFNGRSQILKSDKNAALDAADKRDKYNLIWLKQALVQQDAKAYVFGFQADIYHPSSKPACSESQRSNCDAFKIYRDAISDFAKHTNKPVLVMHGDTGPYCQQQLASNLTRLNVPGDFAVSDVAKVSFIDGQWHIASITTNVPLTKVCK